MQPIFNIQVRGKQSNESANNKGQKSQKVYLLGIQFWYRNFVADCKVNPWFYLHSGEIRSTNLQTQ